MGCRSKWRKVFVFGSFANETVSRQAFSGNMLSPIAKNRSHGLANLVARPLLHDAPRRDSSHAQRRASIPVPLLSIAWIVVTLFGMCYVEMRGIQLLDAQVNIDETQHAQRGALWPSSART